MNSLKLINVIKENTSSLDEIGIKQLLTPIKGDANALKSANKALHGAIDDVLKFAGKDKNQIVGLTAKSPNKVVPLTNVDDFLHAVRTPGGIKDDVLGLFNQGLLKSSKTPADLIDGITIEVVKTNKFKNKYAKLSDGDMKKALKVAGYSDNAVDSFMKNAKKDPNFKKAFKKGVEKRKLKKTQNGKDKNLTPIGNGSNVPAPQKKTLSERAKELMDMIKVKKMSWKQLVAWGVGIGVGAGALWWFLYDSNDIIPDDMPETEPTDIGGEWLECIKEIVKSKEGTSVVDKNGSPVVFVKNEEYPQGLLFYTNGRVYDVASKKRGSWKCKGGVATINEQSDMSLAKDVDTMIDLLDFPVSYSDLKNAGTLLQKYATNGKGKEFLSLYQQSGLGGGDLGKSLKYIYTSEPESVQAKAFLVKTYNDILSGKVTSSSTSTPTSKVGLKNIEITWDGAKTDDGGNKVIDNGGQNRPRKSRFHDCSKKPLPHEFGCRSEQVKQVQICLGLDSKYQTGNFGPKTKQAIEAKNVDLSNGLTQYVIDQICGSERGRELAKIEPITNLKRPELKLATIDPSKMKAPTIKSIYDAGQKLYSRYINDGTLFVSGGRLKYKGDELSSEEFNELNKYISAIGYDFMKVKPKEDYEMKYVWVKQ